METDRRAGRRKVVARYDRGSLVELEDHSLWQVPPGQEELTRGWPAATEVLVVPGTFRDYPYDLINDERGERVPARATDPRSGWRLLDTE